MRLFLSMIKKMFSENSMNTKTCAIGNSDQFGRILKQSCSISDVKFLILNGLEVYFSAIPNLDDAKKNSKRRLSGSRIKGQVESYIKKWVSVWYKKKTGCFPVFLFVLIILFLTPGRGDAIHPAVSD